MGNLKETSASNGGVSPPFLPSRFDDVHSVIGYSGAYAEGYTEVFTFPTGIITAIDNIDINTNWEEWIPFSGGLRFLFVLDGFAQIFQRASAPIALEPLSFGVAIDPLGVRKRQSRIVGRRWKAMAIFCPYASLARLGVRPEDFQARHAESSEGENVRAFAYQGASLRERQHDLVQEIFHPRVGKLFRPLYVEAKSMELLSITLSNLSVGTEAEPEGCVQKILNSEQMDRVEDICRILAKDLEHMPSLAQLSRSVGVNRRQMCADFRVATGRSIGRYVLEKRMTRARDLLSERKSVKYVSHAVGYRHPQNFVTAYKAFFGRTPGFGQN